jgi:hypothetical protein
MFCPKHTFVPHDNTSSTFGEFGLLSEPGVNDSPEAGSVPKIFSSVNQVNSDH